MVASLYGIDEEKKTIWVYLECDQGALAGVSLEMLSHGRQLADQVGWSLAGLLLGHQVLELANEAFAYGADQVRLAEHPLLEHFTIDAYAQVVNQVLLEGTPSVFLLGATPNGRDLAGRLAVRQRTGLNADCTGLQINPENGVLVCEVSGFGGGVLALIEMETHRPQMATVRPGVFTLGEPDHSKVGEVIPIHVGLDEEDIQTRIVEREIGEGVDLTRTSARGAAPRSRRGGT